MRGYNTPPDGINLNKKGPESNSTPALFVIAALFLTLEEQPDFSLEDQLQAQLERPGPALSEGGVGAGDVRRLRPEPE